MGEVEELLTAAVRAATGIPDALPRPGQLRLANDTSHAMKNQGCLVGSAKTGVGKSLGYLVPAADLSRGGERTLISTESLALQEQIEAKDGPAVAKAMAETYARDFTVATLKGWANYVCRASALEEARTQARARGAELPAVTAVPDGTGIADTERARRTLAVISRTTPDHLVGWALSDSVGERHTYPLPIDDSDWAKVSTTPDACVGDGCPLAALCVPRKARARAAAANVVVTNHAMLAVQAAKKVPVVIGNQSIGSFDAIVVDEAHALPPTVRSQGAVAVSAPRLRSLARRTAALLGEGSNEGQYVLDSSEKPTEALGKAIAAQAGRSRDGRIRDDIDPLGFAGDMAMSWSRSAAKSLQAAAIPASHEVEAMRLGTQLQQFTDDVAAVRVHKVGVARWIEPEVQATDSTPGRAPSLSSSPVDVSWMLRDQVWTVPDPDGDEPNARKELPVIAVSATLPKAFGSQIGLRTSERTYESPFADAYAGSLLYVPTLDAGTSRCPTKTSGDGKEYLDTSAHPEWAFEIASALIDASGGGALMLSATSAAGRRYAERLRTYFGDRLTVLSQWDGLSKDKLVGMWKEETDAVLVGTRSYMTGVDAPGRTNRLVIVDRVPRAAGNVVDDARVEVLAERLDPFVARDTVYAGDAAMLLEQAAGRLIRSISDRGMVAVLDPRLLRSSSITYSGSSRAIYMKALGQFQNRSTRLGDALSWLRGKR